VAAESVAVLLDTDIGSDIDDAVALAYLLAHPACQLTGITTVSGDTAQRAACAEAVCDAAGRQVPVHQGLSEPLLDGWGQPEVPQYQAVAHLKEATPRARDAVEFMREVVRARPGEIELLTIGPLTNVAVLFALDPEIPSLLRGLTSMAGWYYERDPERGEWNVIVDPVAAALAFRLGPAGHRCVGLDVTRRVQMGREEVERRFEATPTLRVVLEMARVWFGKREQITFHDPLAAAVVFEPTLCTFEAGTVTISYGPDLATSGISRFQPDPDGRQRVAATVDAEAFFAEYSARTWKS
jgi:purine nucleosidase